MTISHHFTKISDDVTLQILQNLTNDPKTLIRFFSTCRHHQKMGKNSAVISKMLEQQKLLSQPRLLFARIDHLANQPFLNGSWMESKQPFAERAQIIKENFQIDIPTHENVMQLHQNVERMERDAAFHRADMRQAARCRIVSLVIVIGGLAFMVLKVSDTI